MKIRRQFPFVGTSIYGIAAICVSVFLGACGVVDSEEEQLSGSATNSSSSIEVSSSSVELADLSQFVKGEDAVYLDMVVRDFSLGHPDFENFAGRVPESQCAGGELLRITEGNLDWVEKFTGKPGTFQTIGDTMYYGAEHPSEFREMEAYWHYYTVPPFRVLWKDSLTIVSGMAEAELDYSADSLLEAAPHKATNTCYNSRMDEWFRDVPGVNYRSNQLLKLKSYTLPGGENVLGYDSFLAEGFFPLDSINDGEFGFGKQSMDIWCPPPNLSDEGVVQSSACREYWEKWTSAEEVPSIVERSRMARNYHFTTTIAFSFVYQPGQWFVIANDEYWVYADGQMIVDAGGDHLPPEFMVYLDTIAAQRNWQSGTAHTLHFFLAERQSNAADLRFYTNIEYFSYPVGDADSLQVLTSQIDLQDSVPWMRTEYKSSSSYSWRPVISSAGSSSSLSSSSSGVPLMDANVIWVDLGGVLSNDLEGGREYEMKVDTISENCDITDSDSTWVIDCHGNEEGRLVLIYSLLDSVMIIPVMTVRSFVTFSADIDADSIDLELQLLGDQMSEYSNVQIRSTRESDGRNDLRFYGNSYTNENWNTLIFDVRIKGYGQQNFLPDGRPGDLMFSHFLITRMGL